MAIASASCTGKLSVPAVLSGRVNVGESDKKFTLKALALPRTRIFLHRNHPYKSTTLKSIIIMKPITNTLRRLGVASCLTLAAVASASAAVDTSYEENDLLLFFRNPNGTSGQSSMVVSSLGSTYGVFRAAATPGDSSYGTTISLGNLNSLLTTTYGTNWTSPNGNLFVGANGQNGSTVGNATSVIEGDYARTFYVTRARNGAGTYGTANSANMSIATATTTIPSNIQGANSPAINITVPGTLENSGTTLDTWNPLTSQNIVSQAYGAINNGIVGAVSSTTFNFGSINNVAAALDLWRVSPSLNNSGDNTAWQNTYSIASSYGGGSGAQTKQYGWFLGTLTLSQNGDVNFVGGDGVPVPEPGTYVTAALLGVAAFLRWRKRAAVLGAAQ
ncbi:MAG: PEP-CTERM sorting domain-containing protein [Chthoniobacterales bacterium]